MLILHDHRSGANTNQLKFLIFASGTGNKNIIGRTVYRAQTELIMSKLRCDVAFRLYTLQSVLSLLSLTTRS